MPVMTAPTPTASSLSAHSPRNTLDSAGLDTGYRMANATRPVDLLTGGWYTTEELAELITVDPSTLRRWRTSRPVQGPPFITLSSRVTKYSAADVRQWLEAHRTIPGKEA
jgi:hypothetical protein